MEPQRKTLLGWWRPREVSGPTRLSHSRGSCHSAAKVSASRTYFITRPRGEGLGLAEVWPSKSFLPRFFTKKRAGSRGGALAARRSARNAPCASQSAGGGQRGNPRRGFPLCGRPPPPAARATPRGRRWTKERVVEDADPYGGWETGRVPHNIPRDHPTPGRGPVERGGVGGDRSGGTSGTPSPTGRLRRRGAGGTRQRWRRTFPQLQPSGAQHFSRAGVTVVI